MRRGYGVVAILWKKKINHMIKPIDLGSERIQCKEIKETQTQTYSLHQYTYQQKGIKPSIRIPICY